TLPCATPISAAPRNTARSIPDDKGGAPSRLPERRSTMKARVLGLLTAACVMTAASAQAQELLLGYLPSLAGPFATLSRTNEIAAQIAVDEINSAGGIGGKKIRIVSFDTA